MASQDGTSSDSVGLNLEVDSSSANRVHNSDEISSSQKQGHESTVYAEPKNSQTPVSSAIRNLVEKEPCQKRPNKTNYRNYRALSLVQ